MTAHLRKLHFKGLPEWFRQKDYDRSPKDGRFQAAEVTEKFIVDYQRLDLVGQRNVFVYADAEADEKLLLLLYKGSKKAAFNPRDILLPNEKVISQNDLNLFLGSEEKDPVVGHSLIPESFGPSEEDRLVIDGRLLFSLGDPALLHLLNQHGSLLFIGAADEDPDGSISVSTIAHERAHATLNRWKDPGSQQLKRRAADELKTAKEKLAKLFAEIEADNGWRIAPKIYGDDGQIESLHPLVYLYGYEVGGRVERNFSDWFRQQRLESTLQVYQRLFEETMLGDPEVSYNYEHRLWPKQEWVVDAAIEEWMGGRSPQEREQILTNLIVYYQPEQVDSEVVHDRVWRYLERQILGRRDGAENLKGIFSFILFGRDKNPKLARQVFSLLARHPQFFSPGVFSRSYFSPPQFTAEGKPLGPGFFIHEYYDLLSKSLRLGRRIVVLNWEHEVMAPKTIQVMEGTPPYAKEEKGWSWSELHPANAAETQETLTHLWNWQFNRTSLQSSRRENRTEFWWSVAGTSAGLLFGLLGGGMMWQEREVQSFPLGVVIGGAALSSFSSYQLWQSSQTRQSLDVMDAYLQGAVPNLPFIPNSEAAKIFDISKYHPIQIQRPGASGK